MTTRAFGGLMVACLFWAAPLACAGGAGTGGAAGSNGAGGVTGGGQGGSASDAAGTGGGSDLDAQPLMKMDAAPASDTRGSSADSGQGSGADAPRMVAACAGAFLCDDFESYPTKLGGPWIVGSPTSAFSTGNPGSSLVVDGTNVFSGAKSVHIKSGGGNNGGDAMVMRTMKGLPAPMNHVFGRAMMFFRAPWPGTHIRVVGMQSNDQYAGYMLNAHGTFTLEALVDLGGGGGSIPIVTDRWLCVEWEFNAPVGGTVVTRAWIDGAEILPTPKGFPRVDLLDVWIGYTTATKGPTCEMWVDDVAVGTARIGCP